ncbi:hypothetical protein B0H15DRAFT_944163 [Mycena belliarum]|uniref:Uncharacterized protein n=1 Tax=Mycena belliarum TaxID=1033014 RepID=A0AAD6UJ82_9AGAR|nr:hypothetical protein B0H15DRAFT_944163 [Mycena belliae]
MALEKKMVSQITIKGLEYHSRKHINSVVSEAFGIDVKKALEQFASKSATMHSFSLYLGYR